MKAYITDRAATYTPMQYKNFAGALGSFFAAECPQLGGDRTRRVLVDSIIEMVEHFYPETTHLREGQVQWVTVHKDETPSPVWCSTWFARRTRSTVPAARHSARSRRRPSPGSTNRPMLKGGA